ncbi:MAG: hypothetical protein ACRC5H_01050, partial [Treponemataceae bacterium]
FSHSFLSTQINFNNFVFLRTAFYFDMTSKNDFSTNFGIDTAALTFKIRDPALVGYHYISLIYKEDEPLGSGIFLQRHFGIELIDSPVMMSNRGILGNYIYRYIDDSYISGGLAYTLRLDDPTLFAVYATASDKLDTTKINVDFRSALLHDYFVMDVSLGFGFELGRVDSSSMSAPLSFNNTLLRTGVSMVVGDRTGINVFFQLGLADFYVYSKYPHVDELYSFRNLYFVFEPRFYYEAPLAEFPLKFNFTVYSIPLDTPTTLLYVDNPFGIAATLIFDDITMHGLQVAVFMTVSSPSTTFEQVDYMLAASARTKLFNGILDTAFKVRLNKILDISQAYEISVGYRYAL